MWASVTIAATVNVTEPHTSIEITRARRLNNFMADAPPNPRTLTSARSHPTSELENPRLPHY